MLFFSIKTFLYCETGKCKTVLLEDYLFIWPNTLSYYTGFYKNAVNIFYLYLQMYAYNKHGNSAEYMF